MLTRRGIAGDGMRRRFGALGYEMYDESPAEFERRRARAREARTAIGVERPGAAR